MPDLLICACMGGYLPKPHPMLGYQTEQSLLSLCDGEHIRMQLVTPPGLDGNAEITSYAWHFFLIHFSQ